MDNPVSSTLPISPESTAPPSIEPPTHRWSFWILGGIFFVGLSITIGVFTAKFLHKSQSQSQLPQTPTPTQSLAPTPTSDPTANWKTYSNTKYNYSISFPNDFGTQVNAAGAGAQNATSSSDQIFLFKQSAKEPYLERYLEIVPIGQVVDLPPEQWQKVVDVKINGITAVKFESNDPQTFIVYRLAIPNSSGELEIYITKDIQKVTIANQILSTFKFTDQNNEICDLDQKYQNTAVKPVTCQCPDGYEWEIVNTSFGPCPAGKAKDCPQMVQKCSPKN